MPVIEHNPAQSTAPTPGRVLQRTVVVSSAELLALFATPKTLIPAPGANRALIFEDATIEKVAGTAYAGIAAGEDLSIRYTDASGVELGQCEATGFLDQATAQTRNVKNYRAASAISSVTPTANAALVLHMLTGEIITGTSPLTVTINYRVIPVAV